MEHKNLEEEILSQLDEGFLTTGVDSKHTRYDEIPTLENRGTMAASVKDSSYESVEVTSNPIIEMVDSVIAGELTESTGIFEDLLAYKIAQKLEEKKIEVAQSIVEARYSSSKETFYRGFDDSHKLLKKKAEEKNDEVEEKENVNHPLRQLQNIKDQYENPISNEEKQTGNEAATKNALAKRLAGENKGNSQTKPKEGGSSGIEHFKHTNGKSTHLGYDEVKLLHHHLGESGALKPATKTAALSTIHSSPEGLAKVLGALRK